MIVFGEKIDSFPNQNSAKCMTVLSKNYDKLCARF